MRILLSGASGGVGAVVLKDLLERGDMVITIGRKEVPNSSEHLSFDLANTADLASFITQNTSDIDALVHCAGMPYIATAKNFDVAHMEKVMSVNLYSLMAMVQALIKRGNKGRLRHIVALSSIFANNAAPHNAFYSASKGAIDSYIRSIAVELAPKVLANSVILGAIFGTGMTDNVTEEHKAELLSRSYPLGEGRAEDIANLIAFLLSEKGRFITGQALVIDGGFSVAKFI